MNNLAARSVRPSDRAGRVLLARRGGFTLIELLTVIAIIALMLTVMMSAIFQIMAWAKAVPNRVFISRLQIACRNYSKDYNGQAPAVADDPTNTGLTPASISGTQALRLVLVGYSVDNNQITAQSEGTADVTTALVGGTAQYTPGVSTTLPPMTAANYWGSIRKTYDLRVGAHEMLPPNQLLWDNKGPEQTIDVFVDSNFSPVRPILYYRQHTNGSFSFSDNAVYCTQSGETAAGWTPYATAATNAHENFFLIWCGPDRKFFTADDFASVGN